jgi:hypothetical protein
MYAHRTLSLSANRVWGHDKSRQRFRTINRAFTLMQSFGDAGPRIGATAREVSGVEI